MVAVVVGVTLLLLCLAVVIAIAKDRGPGPADVAVSYEHGWDRLDFETVWVLSASELRDGLGRREFVASKRTAYAQRAELRGLAARITVDDVVERGENAIVTTRVELHDGGVVQNALHLVRRSGRWQVASYAMTPAG